MYNILKSELKNETKLLILGFGKEGKSTFKWLQKNFDNLQIGISDKNEKSFEDEIPLHNKNIKLFGGDNYLEALKEYKVIIKSPGVFLSDNMLKGKTMLSQTGIFITKYKKQIIGVTGTKGKSTTASLIHHFLIKNGKKSILLGNIGIPAFDKIDDIENDTHIVYELSAHQLSGIKHSPHIAVLLNVFPEHLDFFGTFENYKNAKLNIIRYQTADDKAINFLNFNINLYDEESLQQIIDKLSDKKITVKQIEKKSPLKGKHNIYNVIAAMTAVQHAGVSPEKCLKVLPGFPALPHRLEFVANINGVNYYNDSISTVPQATIAAVKSLKNVDVLLLGGFNRGIDYTGLADFLSETKIKYIFLTGKAGDIIFELLKAKNINGMLVKVNSLAEAMRKIGDLKNINCVLLSPAAASYDAFHNFEHRGDTFRNLVYKMEGK